MDLYLRPELATYRFNRYTAEYKKQKNEGTAELVFWAGDTVYIHVSDDVQLNLSHVCV